MMQSCRQFLTDRLQDLLLPDGYTRPFTLEPSSLTIFFQELPRDFLKDNDYAVCCLPLIDRNRKNGKLIGKSRDTVAKTETLIRRRFNREIMFRCMLFAPGDDLYGTAGFTGLMEQFNQAVAEYHHIASADNSVIMVEPQDCAISWDSEQEQGRKLDRPPLGIVRVQFSGGIQTSRTRSLITSVTIVPTPIAEMRQLASENFNIGIISEGNRSRIYSERAI